MEQATTLWVVLPQVLLIPAGSTITSEHRWCLVAHYRSEEEYAHLVPFVEAKGEVVSRTIIPSRKATRRYLTQSQGAEG